MAVSAPVSRTRMEVFTDALRHNFEVVRFLAGRKRDIIAVIKADAYGHGAVRAARLYRENGCGRFAVARLCEAVELREAGISEDRSWVRSPRSPPPPSWSTI